MKCFLSNLLLFAGILSLILVGCSNDSAGGEDDELRLVNSLAVEGLQIRYVQLDTMKAVKADETVTLTTTGSPPETVELVSFIEDHEFEFTATRQGVQGSAICIVGREAVTTGVAEVVIFPTVNFMARDTIMVECSSNWK